MAAAEIMANRAQVCLQFMDKLNDVFGSSHFCDLIFELRGHQFFAHRAVLAAWSPLVYGIFSKEKCMTEKIRLNYDNIEAFGSFVSFLYSGQLNSDAEGHLIQVLHLATSLQVNILRHTCEEALKRQLHIGNIISTFHVARKFRLPNLEEYALNFMQMNLPEAVKQTDFLSLSPPRFNSFLSSGWVCVMKPEVKLFLIISWLGYDVKERQQYLVLLLRYIDWSTVANDFLLEISQTENFFTTNESSLYLLLQTLFSSTIPLGPYTDLFPGLREKYGFLLDHIIHNSYMLPVEPEEYFPVSFQLATILPSASPHSGYQVKKSSKTREPDPSFISGVNENDNASNEEHGDQAVGDCVISEERFEKDRKDLETYNLASLGCTLEEAQLSGSLPKDFIKLPALCKKESAMTSMARRGRPRRAVATAKICSDSARLASLSTKTTYQKISTEANSIRPEIKMKTTRKERKVTDERVNHQTDSKVAGLDPDDGVTGKQKKRKAPSRFTVPEKPIPLKRRAVSRKNVPRKMASDKAKTSDKEQSNTSSVDGSAAERSPGKMAENELLSHNEEADSGEHAQFENLVNKAPVGAQIVVPAAKRTSNATLTNKKQTSLTEHVQLEQSASSHKELPACLLSAEESVPQEQKRTFPHLPDNANKPEEHSSSASCSAVSAGLQKPAHVKQGTVFSCTVCSFECFWRMAFYSHMRQHFPGPPHVCDHEGCGYAASKIQPFLIHRRKHTDERPYKCTHCGALFRNSNNLYAHLKCHSEDKKFECPVCKRRFRMKNTMEQHMVIHSDDRPYLCDTCGFSTKYQSHLIAHKRIHTGEVFHCGFPMCKYYSPKRSQLKAHMRSHLNVRHFACEICQKSFVEKSHLVRHRRIHQEDRPFRCEKCDYSSTRMDKLREHVERHHGDNPTVKRKFTPRKKKSTSSSIPTTSSTTATSSSSIKMVSSALPKENHWGQNVEASIATLVSAAEEVQLASEIRESTGQVYDRASGQELVPNHSLAANCEDRAQTDGYGLHERVVGRIEYAASGNLGQTVGAATGSSSQGVEDGVRSLTRSSGKSVAINSTQLSYDSLHPKQFHHIHPNNHQNLSHPPQHVSLHIQHHAPASLLQQPQQVAHTSASLLQQLAMSVGAASGNEQVSLSSSVVSNTNPIVLARSISADMPVAPHILLSTMPQHATASAADSLASLSHGLTLSLLSTQSGVNAAGLQQAFQSSGLHVTPAQLTLQQQQEHHQQQQQPPPTQSSQQNPDFGGLNAFMALL